jgi:hypothetical protein
MITRISLSTEPHDAGDHGKGDIVPVNPNRGADLDLKPGGSHSKVAESATLLTVKQAEKSNADSALLKQGKKLRPDLDEGRKLGEKPGAGLDAQDRQIEKLLAAGWSVQCLVVEHGIELSDIRRLLAAGAR